MDNTKPQQNLVDFLTGLNIPDPLFEATACAENVTEMWQTELLSGYAQNPLQIITPDMAAYPGQMIVVKDIPFISFCLHHLLPFEGVAHVAYVAGAKVTGLSRLPKLVQCFARRLQIQERMTDEIATALMTGLEAQGAACLIRARHFCMLARGERTPAIVVTTSFRGVFESEERYRLDFRQQTVGG